MSECDLKLTGGTIIDGTGSAAYGADIAIHQGRIAAIGHALGRARRQIDATGLIVAPGFVGVHPHYDAQVLWDRMLSISPWHGVTTAVIGNCGSGIAPARPESFPEYLSALERHGVAINVGALVGHTPLRLFVMGADAATRMATGAELEQMSALLREALAAGALGLGTSWAVTHNGFRGRPAPSRLVEELQALARVVGEFDGRIVQLARANTESLELMGEIAALTRGAVTYAALFAEAEAQGPLDPAVETDLDSRVRTAVANSDEDRVADLLRDPHVVVALSDADAHRSCDACYPTYLLQRWVREKGVLSLEEGVRVLTSRPAEVFGIAGRGVLAPGYAADVVLFDADCVGPGPLTRVRDLPSGTERLICEARGIAAVIVNGTPLRRHGIDLCASNTSLPGRVLRASAGG